MTFIPRSEYSLPNKGDFYRIDQVLKISIFNLTSTDLFLLKELLKTILNFISINLLAFYHESRVVSGYATRYSVVDGE